MQDIEQNLAARNAFKYFYFFSFKYCKQFKNKTLTHFSTNNSFFNIGGLQPVNKFSCNCKTVAENRPNYRTQILVLESSAISSLGEKKSSLRLACVLESYEVFQQKVRQAERISY